MRNLDKAFALSMAAAALCGCHEDKKESRKPNILFIMTDDHTTQAMSCYGGSLLHTPNMDRIAEEGIRFDNCYATNALSGPSRACIMTGKFSHINTAPQTSTSPSLPPSPFQKQVPDWFCLSQQTHACLIISNSGWAPSAAHLFQFSSPYFTS